MYLEGNNAKVSLNTSARKSKVDSLVQEYRDAWMVTKYTETRMGMEGEITLCVQFNDFQTAYVFNNSVAKLIETGRNTSATRILSCNENDIIQPNE